jgi:hypothetical protein
MEFSEIKTLLFDIKTNIEVYFAEIYDIEKKTVPNDNFNMYNMIPTNNFNMYNSMVPIIKTNRIIKRDDITDYFTHFQNSGLHGIIEAIVAESCKLNNDDVTMAIKILEENYVVWKKLFCGRTYHVRSSKVLGSTSGFLIGTGLFFGSPIIATGGILGVCGSICLYAWMYGIDDTTEKSSFDDFYESIGYVTKIVNKVEVHMFESERFRASIGYNTRIEPNIEDVDVVSDEFLNVATDQIYLQQDQGTFNYPNVPQIVNQNNFNYQWNNDHQIVFPQRYPQMLRRLNDYNDMSFTELTDDVDIPFRISKELELCEEHSEDEISNRASQELSDEDFNSFIKLATSDR